MSEGHYLGMGGRLKKKPSRGLAESAFAYELESAIYLFEPMGYADMAHAAMLMRSGALPAERARPLLAALLSLHEEDWRGFELDPYLGDVYNNRAALLEERLGEDSGAMHMGRARREASTVAWQIACRQRLLELGQGLTALARSMLEFCERYRDAIMPDFTYLHHAQPTTVAHYFLGFLYPILRDEERVRGALGRLNRCPAGSGSVNGSRVPMDREYIAELLGFQGLVEHTRDAMWAPDLSIEAMSALATTLTNLDRVAEDLQLWTTEEFGFARLDDGHVRASVIMPQKRNPYSLAFIRGRARQLIGRWAGLAAAGMTPSGQPDNRIFSYFEVPECIDGAVRCVALLAEVFAGMSLNTARMEAAARSGYAYATDLCDALALTTGIPQRRVHSIIGRAVRACAEGGGAPVTAERVRSAAREMGLGELDFDDALIEDNREPAMLIAVRQGRGGAGPAPMKRMLTEVGEGIAEQEAFWGAHPLRGFPETFLAGIESLARGAP